MRKRIAVASKSGRVVRGSALPNDAELELVGLRTGKPLPAATVALIAQRKDLGGESVSAICENLGTAPNAFHRWQKELFDHAAAAFEVKGRGKRPDQRALLIYIYSTDSNRRPKPQRPGFIALSHDRCSNASSIPSANVFSPDRPS